MLVTHLHRFFYEVSVQRYKTFFLIGDLLLLSISVRIQLRLQKRFYVLQVFEDLIWRIRGLVSYWTT